jgi:hypothetical protein
MGGQLGRLGSRRPDQGSVVFGQVGKDRSAEPGEEEALDPVREQISVLLVA